MDEMTFYKIIDSLAEMNFCGKISPHFYGEPLMDNRLTTFLLYIKNKLPKTQLKLFTNGDLLSLDKYKELCDVGVDVFRVSQHSINPSNAIVETLDYIKNHDNEIWIRPIEYINLHNRHYKLNNVIKRNIFDNQGNIFYNRGPIFYNRGCRFYYHGSKFCNPGGIFYNIELTFENRGGIIQNIPQKNRNFCLFVNQLTFDYEGNAVLCCNDFLSSVKFGNIKNSSVKEIWYNADYVNARRKIMSGNWIFDVCKKCNF